MESILGCPKYSDPPENYANGAQTERIHSSQDRLGNYTTKPPTNEECAEHFRLVKLIFDSLLIALSKRYILSLDIVDEIIIAAIEREICEVVLTQEATWKSLKDTGILEKVKESIRLQAVEYKTFRFIGYSLDFESETVNPKYKIFESEAQLGSMHEESIIRLPAFSYQSLVEKLIWTCLVRNLCGTYVFCVNMRCSSRHMILQRQLTWSVLPYRTLGTPQSAIR